MSICRTDSLFNQKGITKRFKDTDNTVAHGEKKNSGQVWNKARELCHVIQTHTTIKKNSIDEVHAQQGL